MCLLILHLNIYLLYPFLSFLLRASIKKLSVQMVLLVWKWLIMKAKININFNVVLCKHPAFCTQKLRIYIENVFTRKICTKYLIFISFYNTYIYFHVYLFMILVLFPQLWIILNKHRKSCEKNKQISIWGFFFVYFGVFFNSLMFCRIKR